MRLEEIKMAKTSEKDMEKLAFELYRYLKNKGYEGDVRIYYKGGHCISDCEDYSHKGLFVKNTHVYRGKEYEYYECTEEIKGSTYFEYANDDTLSVSTEGVLCEILNCYLGGRLYDKVNEDLNKMFEKYGLYFELGHHWNFSLYEI